MPAEKGTSTPKKTLWQRISYISYALSGLSWPEQQELFKSAQQRNELPERNKRKRDAEIKMAWPNRSRMWEVYKGIPDEPFGDPVDEPKVPAADRPPGSAAAAAHLARENVKACALEDFFATGSADPVPSRLPGTKQQNRAPILSRMANLIHGGVSRAADGKTLIARAEWPLSEDAGPVPAMERIWRGLAECERVSAAFKEDRDALGI